MRVPKPTKYMDTSVCMFTKYIHVPTKTWIQVCICVPTKTWLQVCIRVSTKTWLQVCICVPTKTWLQVSNVHRTYTPKCFNDSRACYNRHPRTTPQYTRNVTHNMWEHRVEIEGYSIAYFDRIAVFEAPYCWTSIKGGAHMRFIDAWIFNIPLSIVLPIQQVGIYCDDFPPWGLQGKLISSLLLLAYSLLHCYTNWKAQNQSGPTQNQVLEIAWSNCAKMQ